MKNAHREQRGMSERFWLSMAAWGLGRRRVDPPKPAWARLFAKGPVTVAVVFVVVVVILACGGCGEKIDAVDFDYSQKITYDALQTRGDRASKEALTRYLLTSSTETIADMRLHFTDSNGNEWVTIQPIAWSDKTGIWK